MDQAPEQTLRFRKSNLKGNEGGDQETLKPVKIANDDQGYLSDQPNGQSIDEINGVLNQHCVDVPIAEGIDGQVNSDINEVFEDSSDELIDQITKQDLPEIQSQHQFFENLHFFATDLKEFVLSIGEKKPAKPEVTSRNKQRLRAEIKKGRDLLDSTEETLARNMDGMSEEEQERTITIWGHIWSSLSSFFDRVIDAVKRGFEAIKNALNDMLIWIQSKIKAIQLA